jgi:hypothetical protein
VGASAVAVLVIPAKAGIQRLSFRTAEVSEEHSHWMNGRSSVEKTPAFAGTTSESSDSD